MRLFISEMTKKKIGFDYIIEKLVILSPYGSELINNLEPYTSKNKLEEEYQLIQFFIDNLPKIAKVEMNLAKIKNILPTIRRCEKGFILDIVELYEIKIQAILMNKIKDELRCFDYNNFKINDCQNIISLLSDGDKITYDFYIYESYSEKLKSIRLEKHEIEKQIRIANDDEKKVLKIKRAKIVSLEEEEENKIKVFLTQKLIRFIPLLKDNIKMIGHIDLLIAKAKLAVKYHGIKPNITNNKLLFKKLIHPLIKMKVEEKKLIYTKNNIELKFGTTILTGANMSGKSSILKTIALNVYLAQLGFYVFAEKADIPLVKGIKYLGSDVDDIHGYSAFGREIIALNEVIKDMREGSILLCVDEFSRTTNPYEGEKFVRALAKYAHMFSSYTIIATHYDGIANENMQHYQIKGLKDFGDVKRDEILSEFNRYMDYSVMKVTHNTKVPHEAYKVSILLNIDEDFKQILDVCYKE